MSARKRSTKPRKPSKLVLARRAAKMLHVEWSKAVRERDGYVCLLCASTKNVQAHHWYVGKRACPALAHDTDNGASLCLFCHQVLAHKQGTYRTHARIRAAMVTVLGAARLNALISKAKALCTLQHG